MRNKILVNLSNEDDPNISDVILEKGNFYIQRFTNDEILFIINSDISDAFLKFEIYIDVFEEDILCNAKVLIELIKCFENLKESNLYGKYF